MKLCQNQSERDKRQLCSKRNFVGLIQAISFDEQIHYNPHITYISLVCKLRPYLPPNISFFLETNFLKQQIPEKNMGVAARFERIEPTAS